MKIYLIHLVTNLQVVVISFEEFSTKLIDLFKILVHLA